MAGVPPTIRTTITSPRASRMDQRSTMIFHITHFQLRSRGGVSARFERAYTPAPIIKTATEKKVLQEPILCDLIESILAPPRRPYNKRFRTRITHLNSVSHSS